MFERLMALLTGTDTIKEAYKTTFSMIDTIETLFEAAADFMVDGKKPTINIHKEDKTINKREVAVRRIVLEHLSVSPQAEVSASLVLTLLVGFIERVGDNIKNIEELAELYDRPLRECPFAADLVTATDGARHMIELTRQALTEEDELRARDVIALHRKTRKLYNGMIDRVFEDPDLTKNDALVCALYARYLKRVCAGMKNVCTTLTAPYDHIGYTRWEEGPKDED